MEGITLTREQFKKVGDEFLKMREDYAKYQKDKGEMTEKEISAYVCGWFDGRVQSNKVIFTMKRNVLIVINIFYLLIMAFMM